MPMMMSTTSLSKLYCLSPQMLRSVVETMHKLATAGMMEAAADLAHLIASAVACHPTSGRSPKRRRRKKKRKQSRRCHLAADMVNKQNQQVQHRGEFDIGSMSKTIDLLQGLYSPTKHSLLAPKSRELAQPQGGLVSGRAPATLPAHQPPTPLSKPLREENLEMAFAKQGEELIEKEADVDEATGEDKEVKQTREVFLEQNMLITNDNVEEQVEIACQEVKEVLSADQVNEEPIVNTIQQPIVVDVASLKHEEEAFAKLDEEQLKLNKQDEEEVGTSVPDQPRPFHPRHQENRLKYAHLKTSQLKGIGKQSRWTKESLLFHLEAAFSNPRRGVIWTRCTLEEKVNFFDMVDWAAYCPDDPPSRALMFQPDEDPWSTWA